MSHPPQEQKSPQIEQALYVMDKDVRFALCSAFNCGRGERLIDGSFRPPEGVLFPFIFSHPPFCLQVALCGMRLFPCSDAPPQIQSTIIAFY